MMAPLSAQAAKAIKVPKWDETVEVIVVGAGGAGLFAALEAKNNGANVLVLEKNPTNSLALYNLAAIAYNKHDYSHALELYKSSYDNDRKNYRIYFNIANCYYKKNDYDKAKEYFKKCIEYCPKYIQAYINFANLLIETGNYKEAQRKVRTAYLLDKNSAYTSFAFGIILMKSEKFDEAIEKFENAIKIAPDYILAYMGKAEALLNLDRAKEAFSILISVIDSAIQLPEFQELLTRVIENLPENSELEEMTAKTAFESCNKFLEMYNNDKVLAIKNTLLEKFKFEAN